MSIAPAKAALPGKVLENYAATMKSRSDAALGARGEGEGDGWSQQLSGLTTSALSCVNGSVGFCVALVVTSAGSPNTYGDEVTTDGSSWTLYSIGNLGYNWDLLSCGSTTVCAAIGSSPAGATAAIWSTDGGQSWSTPTTLSSGSPPSFSSLACPSASTCYIAGEASATTPIVEVTTNGGTSWQTVSPAALTATITTMSCPAATTCIAGTSSGQSWMTTDGGTAWSSSTISSSYGQVNALSCGTASNCVAEMTDSQNNPVMFSTGNGGSTWTAYTTATPAVGPYPNGLQCVGASDCYMAGKGWHAGQSASTWATVDGGAEWFPQNAADGPTSGTAALSCVATASCVFIGGNTIWDTTDGGGMPPTVTLLAPVPADPVFGQVIFLIADVTGSYGRPAGTVAFSFEGNSIGFCSNQPLESGPNTNDAIADCALFFSGSGGGQVPLTAQYSGDAQQGSSSGNSSIGLHEPGYRMVAGDGGIFDYGTAFHGSLAGVHLTYAINDCASDFETTGYWMVSAGGAVHPFDAPYAGEVVNVPVSYDPIVAVAGTLDGDGYWLIGRLGDVYALGDATNYGSTAHFQAKVVAIVPTPDDLGYWVAFSDGYVAAKGDASNYGNLLDYNIHVKNIVGMASTPDGNGYWLVGSDGGIFTFGGAKYRGSMGGHHLNKPVVGMTNDPATGGYWLVASDGGIFAFDAQFLGSAGSLHLNSLILSMSVG